MSASANSYGIKIGTRASQLALWQAEYVRDLLAKKLSDVSLDIVPMTTKGDQQQEGGMQAWGYKGLFTKEIEETLLEGQVDMAVHSLKDMPSELPFGLTIAAFLPREDPRDALILREGKTLDDLPEGATFGTASTRRGSQIKRLRPDLNIVPLRGNVQTRLRKVKEGEVDGTLLAYAGLKRMKLEKEAAQILDTDTLLPAVGQGIVAVECRAMDMSMLGLLASLSDENATSAALAERAMLKVLDGSCRTPIAGHATLDGDQLTLRGCVYGEGGSHMAEAKASGDREDAEALGKEVGAKLKTDAAAFIDWVA